MRASNHALCNILQRSRLCYENRYSRDTQSAEQPRITACKYDLYKREPLLDQFRDLRIADDYDDYGASRYKIADLCQR